MLYEDQILNEKRVLTGKDLNLGKFEGKRRRWQSMRLNSVIKTMNKFGQPLGDGSLTFCGPQDCKELDTP